MSLDWFWHKGRLWPPIAGGSGDGEGEGAGEGTDDGSGEGGSGGAGGGDGGAGGSGGTGNGGTDDKGKPYASFPTARSLNERLTRAKEQETAVLAKAAGFGDDVEGFKTHLAQTKERRDREAGEVTTLKSRVQDLEGQLTQANEKSKRMALRSAVETEASKLGFIDPDDAYSLGDYKDVSFDDDGNVDRKAVSAVLKTLVEKKPHLVNAQGGNANGQSQGRQGGQQRQGAGAAGGASNPPRGGGQQLTTQQRTEAMAARHPDVFSRR
jgi:hypothetical protein